jgi:phosphoglycolate phosphatase
MATISETFGVPPSGARVNAELRTQTTRLEEAPHCLPAQQKLTSGDMVQLVLFDVDGTLVHTGGAGIKAFAKAFATEFNVHNGVEKILFAGRTDVNLVREFFGFHNIAATPENFRRFFERYVFWLDQTVAQSNGGICRGVRKFLDDLRALPNPPTLGLLTGNIRLGAEIKLRRYNLWDVFETGAFADDGEDRSHIAAAALERGSRVLGRKLSGDEVVVVGDTPHDVRCGRSIGAKILAVATGGATLDELKKHQPDWVMEDFTRINASEVCAR